MNKFYNLGTWACFRAPDKSAYWKAIFLISHPKHMLKLMGKKKITILSS